MEFVACMKHKRSGKVRDAFNDFLSDFRGVWSFRIGRGGEFFKHMEQWLDET